MSRRELLDVVIVGAGVVGSAAALCLAREGLQIAIVEAHGPKPWRIDEDDLRVVAFAPDAQALLDTLGIWAKVSAARAQPFRRMRVWDAAGGGELDFDADSLGCDSLGHIVENSLLVDRLWTGVAAEPSIQRHCPDKLLSIEHNLQDSTLQLASGNILRARLVIGADGAASRVRELAGLTVNEHDYHQRAVVAYVSTEKKHDETCWQRFLPTGPLAMLPCTNQTPGSAVADQQRSSIVWTLPENAADRLLALDDAAFCRELTRAFDTRLGEVLAVSQRAAFPLRRQLANEMLIGRIALIGDAAHAVHPLAGQGVNLGLRDVAALRELVREDKSRGQDFATPHRLARWARTRVSENALSAYSFEALNAFFSNDAVLPTLLRGPALGLVGKFKPLTNAFWKRAAGI